MSEETQEERDKKEEEELKKKQCPFNPKLACEDCRLYRTFPGGRGKKCCVFVRI